MIKEFSDKLKKRREELGLSFKDIVEKTKICPSVIKHIEEGEWEEINPTYLKGFLKIYTSVLGINIPDEILTFIRGRKEEKKTSIKKNITYQKRERPSVMAKLKSHHKILKISKKSILSILKIVGVIIIFLIIIKLAFFLRKNKKNTTPQKTSIPVEIGKKYPPSSSKLKMIDVTIQAKKKTYIVVKVDGEVVFDNILDRGATESWQGKIIEFKISDASGVIIERNGEILPPITKAHRPIKKLIITSASIKVSK